MANAFLQTLAPQHFLTWCAGKIATCRWVWFKNAFITFFIKRYKVDLSIAQIDDIAAYPDFNSFFTRYLKAGCRPIDNSDANIVSPADGCISQLGKIKQNQLLQAKNYFFTLEGLLGQNEKLASLFMNGQFATIYLAPKDYHRVHMPMDGKLIETVFVPGKLFSVNNQTAQSVSNLFARNERLICLFETAIGPMVVILVGAMLVGSINTVWQDQAFKGSFKHQVYTHDAISLKKGDELGHFKMGSTVILLFPENTMNFSSHLQTQTTVLMGSKIASIS